jgi:uncharacterized protein (DUF1015 family)
MVPPVPILRPLRAMRYGRDHRPHLDELISPSVRGEPEDKAQVGDVHPHNIRRLVRGDTGPLAGPDDPPFTHAGRLLSRWKEDGIVTRDGRPALYVYGQRVGGVERRGVVGLVRLDREGTARLLPHEEARGDSSHALHTQLAAMGCQVSLVMAIVPDRRGVLADYLAAHPGGNDVEVHDGHGGQNRVWRDEDPEHHVRLGAALADEPAVIADGHHRVEAALRYQAARAGGQPVTRERPYDYVMTLLVPMDQPELTSKPTHRVCEALGPAARGVLDRLDGSFVVQELGHGGAAAWLAGDGVRFVLVRPGRMVGLRLREDLDAVTRTLRSLPAALRAVEPAVLGAMILDPMMAAEIGEGWSGDGGDTGGAASNSSFSHNRTSADEVTARALAGDVQAAFLLRPVPNRQIVAVAEAGVVMPPKSTNFHPKPIKGLLMNSLVSF